MPDVQITFYKDPDGSLPAYEWLKSLPKKSRARGHALIHLLAEEGHKLRRPYADYLRDGIYELRWRWQRINYRLLYFFRGQNLIMLSHGVTKTDRMPEKEIDVAKQRKKEIEHKNQRQQSR